LTVVALLLGTAEASYGVNSLSESLCHFAQRVDHDVGDDRSPVVVGSKGVYYVGDGGTGSFFSSNLTLQVSTPADTSSFKGSSAFAGAFHVDIASGKVTLIHEMADGQVWTTDTPLQASGNWAASGVMERRGDTIKLLAPNPNWGVDRYQGGVYRYHLNGTFHSKLYTGYLDDDAPFTVNYWSNHNKRWFAHAQGAPTNADGTPRFPALTENEWILSCGADHFWSGASTMSCAVCSLVVLPLLLKPLF
jgi:hypothetical protein